MDRALAFVISAGIVGFGVSIFVACLSSSAPATRARVVLHRYRRGSGVYVDPLLTKAVSAGFESEGFPNGWR